ncbi:MAG: hypothetical protein ICV80_22230 [Microcoleus sp. T1-bin1]|nr:hypothetical protein [Microcoleus sp. T1-bin1]
MIDSTKARRELGWKSEISLNDGVAGVIKWVEEFWDEIEKESLEYIHKP